MAFYSTESTRVELENLLDNPPNKSYFMQVHDLVDQLFYGARSTVEAADARIHDLENQNYVQAQECENSINAL